MTEKTKTAMKSVAFISFSILITIMAYHICFDMININIPNIPETVKFTDPNLKYILIWKRSNCLTIKSLARGQGIFWQLPCPINNCYITEDRTIMNNITDFDVILFHGPDLKSHSSLPVQRKPQQQYVFFSKESSHYYPIWSEKYDHFFNWTWTYRLNSDLYFGYSIIKDEQGNVIGPKEHMNWLDIEEMKPIDNVLKEELGEKKLAAAWFVSNCNTPSKREKYVKEIEYEFSKYNMTLDIYGKCGTKYCPKFGANSCNMLLKKSYYFYLAFENSFSEDYVTEKILTALLNNAVPVVYGGADYTRFLPDGSYLDARGLGVENLVRHMFDAINDKLMYYDFFKWRSHYSFHDPVEMIDTNYYCNFCSKVNEKSKVMGNDDSKFVYTNHFRKWWNSPLPTIEELKIFSATTAI